MNVHNLYIFINYQGKLKVYMNNPKYADIIRKLAQYGLVQINQ